MREIVHVPVLRSYWSRHTSHLDLRLRQMQHHRRFSLGRRNMGSNSRFARVKNDIAGWPNQYRGAFRTIFLIQ